MKNIKLIAVVFLVPLLAAFYLGENDPGTNNYIFPDSTGTVAFVKKIVKDVTYRKTSEQSDWDLAKSGTVLNDGGEVKTGTKSLALVLFTDGSGLLRVRENSILHVYGTKKGNSMDKNTVIQRGLIGFDVKKQSADEEFKFTTPTVVASIRGTEGFILYSEDSTFTMYLSSGSAGIYSQSDCDSVAAGNTIVIQSNGQCISRAASEEDIKTFNAANQTSVKRIKIKTNKGEVDIEYYGPEE